MFEDWPDLVPSSRVKKDLGWSNKTYYYLVKQPGFPSIRVKDKFYVLKAPFIKWLEEQSMKDKSNVEK